MTDLLDPLPEIINLEACVMLSDSELIAQVNNRWYWINHVLTGTLYKNMFSNQIDELREILVRRGNHDLP